MKLPKTEIMISAAAAITFELISSPFGDRLAVPSPCRAVVLDLAEQEHLVVHREAEEDCEHHQRDVAGDRIGAARRVQADDGEPPSPLEARGQDAECGRDGEKVHERRLRADDERAVRHQQDEEAEENDRQDDQEQARGNAGGQIHVTRGRPADVRAHALRRDRLWNDEVAKLGHKVGSRGHSGIRRGNRREDSRVPGFVDVRRGDDLDALRPRDPVLKPHEPRIGSALVASRLRQLVRQLCLQLLGLLLLLLRLLLLALELDLLRLQVRRLRLRIRRRDLDLRGLLGQGQVLLVDRIRLLAELLGLICERDRRLRQLLLVLGEILSTASGAAGAGCGASSAPAGRR